MVAPEKAALRKVAMAARARAKARVAAADMTQALLQAVGPTEGQVIAGYMPIKSEADPVPALTRWARDTRVCLPVIEAHGQPLRFRAWVPGAAMIEGAFGAAIPAEGPWCIPQIVIVPLVAFDARLNRLGYGGGFYDRTLAGLRVEGPVRAVGFAFAAQEVAQLPVEPTDEPLDAIVTEAGTLAAPLDRA